MWRVTNMGTNTFVQDSPKEEDALPSSVNEEEKIKELMSRSDTAVIYPEPVSDQDDMEDDLTETNKDEIEAQETLHSSTSSLPRSNSCLRCAETFDSEMELTNHMLIHTDTVPLCRICNKTFANVYRLQRHLISHDESTDLRKFKCPECSKAFKFKHHLKEHIRIHSGEKPLHCRNCGKRFSHSGSYSSHMSSKKCWSTTSPNGRVPMKNGNVPLFDFQAPPRFGLNHMPMIPFVPFSTASSLPSFLSPIRDYHFTRTPEPFFQPSPKLDIKEETREESKMSQEDLVDGLDTTLASLKRLRKEWCGEAMELYKNRSSETHMMCQYCEEKFTSAVDLHQHERYLCEMNSSPTKNDDDNEKDSRDAISSADVLSSNEEDFSDAGSKDTNDKSKCRVRSLISEDQLHVLRSYYKVNPRPRKHDLIKIGDEIGFPKRVVQVWFQNMRARDRKNGREVPYFPNMARSPRQNDSSPDKFPFIPAVPRPFGAGSSVNFTPAHSHHSAKSNQTSPNELPLPLDLTTPRSRASTPGHTKASSESGALNLSFKPSSPASVRSDELSRSRALPAFPNFPLSPARLFDRNGNFCGDKGPQSLNFSPRKRVSSDDSASECSSTMEDSSDLTLPTAAPWLCAFPPSAETLMRQRMRTSPNEMENDNRFSIMSIMAQKELAELRNATARRPWKAVKEEEDGVYNCDECEKRFSKQSSLARHKYEHSGARPFACDVCPKAFKHKHHLTEHKRLHSGEKPFVCNKCGKRFSHSGSYSQHMNHRYKYCKPMKLEGDGSDGESMKGENFNRDMLHENTNSESVQARENFTKESLQTMSSLGERHTIKLEKNLSGRALQMTAVASI